MRRTEVVSQISEAIHKAAPTATAILYGSEARGDARSDSDIDVLILLDGDKMSLQREMEVTGPLNEIEWQTGGAGQPNRDVAQAVGKHAVQDSVLYQCDK